MSWLARSLANSLGIDDDGESNPQENDDVSRNSDSTRNFHNKSSFSDRQNRQYGPHEEFEEEDEDDSRGVKEDLSEFRETLTRQLRGVANFLAPSPPPPPPPPPRHLVAPDHYPDQITVSEFDQSESSDPSVFGDDAIQDQVAGENGDPSDVGGVSVRGISRFTERDRDQTVPEDFQLDMSYGQLGSRVEEPDWIHKAVGVTDEVLAFAGNIAHHPETWLDFPIEEEDDVDDFDMSESQKEHAVAIESLTPRLKALRIELCPAHMSEGYFWKVYFVLLHSRLNKHDAKLLSTSQVVEARAKWMHELQKCNKEELERQRFYQENAFLHDDFNPSSPHFQQPDNYPLWTFASEPASSSTACDSETEKHPPVIDTEAEFVDKSVIEERPVVKTVFDKNIASDSSPKLLLNSFVDDNDNDDDWPEDDLSEDGKVVAPIPLGLEEEVSFSDLEDDDCSLHDKYNIGSNG